MPFVGRASVKTSIAKAFNDGKLPGLVFEGHIPDESSDQNGTRIVLPLRKDVSPSDVLAGLYQHTSLQTSFSVQMTFLFGAENEPARTPRTIGMVELLRRYNEHQLNVLRRRSEYDLARARERLHLVEGLIVGAVHADDIVKIFQAAKDRQVARAELIKRFKLSEIQAQKHQRDDAGPGHADGSGRLPGRKERAARRRSRYLERPAGPRAEDGRADQRRDAGHRHRVRRRSPHGHPVGRKRRGAGGRGPQRDREQAQCWWR